MPNVEFKNIVKQFGRVTVLEDLDLTVNDGEFLVLLGPSGCGKTTLLNLLAGLQEVTAGTITIGGRDVTDLDPKDRGLAMVFQSYALYPTKTVRGNLKFGLSAQRLDRAEIERRVDWAAQLLRIEPLLDRSPRSSPAASASASPSAARSSRTSTCSCSTNRCPTSMPSCAPKCAWRSRGSTTTSRRRSSTSPTTRSRR